MAFLQEEVPAYGIAVTVMPGIRRLVAPNPGPMTYHGTNTWLIDEPGGAVVIDPGPADEGHLRAILAATTSRVARILVTHTHPDHVGAVPSLRAATGARVSGWGKPWDPAFAPDETLADGQVVGGLQALHTPGHASDHLCFAQAATGALFTGDHVMSWNTSIVALPDGNVADYMRCLRLLLARRDTVYLCGHGPVLHEPQAMVRAMLTHRAGREAAILGALGATARTAADVVATLYAGLDARLVRPAELTVQAHLAKLEGEGRVARDGMAWRLQPLETV